MSATAHPMTQRECSDAREHHGCDDQPPRRERRCGRCCTRARAELTSQIAPHQRVSAGGVAADAIDAEPRRTLRRRGAGAALGDRGVGWGGARRVAWGAAWRDGGCRGRRCGRGRANGLTTTLDAGYHVLPTWAPGLAETHALGIEWVRCTSVVTDRLIAVASGFTHTAAYRAHDVAAYNLCTCRGRAPRDQHRCCDSSADHRDSSHPASHQPGIESPAVGRPGLRAPCLTDSKPLQASHAGRALVGPESEVDENRRARAVTVLRSAE